MALPKLTHLQFMTIGFLQHGARCGHDLRVALRRSGVRTSAPAFYQMMSRLEDHGLVRGSYDQQIVDGQMIRKRCYEVNALGARARQASRDFYARWSAGDEPGAAPA